jgi:hypothetical protein
MRDREKAEGTYGREEGTREKSTTQLNKNSTKGYLICLFTFETFRASIDV